MSKISLNPTPVRTSENYGINDIKLDLKIPKVKKFDNYTIISSEIEKLEIMDIKDNSNDELYSDIGLRIEKNLDVMIVVPEHARFKEPIIIEFEFDEDNIVLADNIKVLYKKDAKADFIFKYKSLTDEKCFHYLKQTTLSNAGAKGKITIVNMLNKESDSLLAIENDLDRAANIDYAVIDLGGKTRITNYHSHLEGEDAKSEIKTMYVADNDDLIDMNYNIELLKPNTVCEFEVEGAIDGNAKKNFKGTIDFKEGSNKAIGHENENCMILSKNAKSKSLPMLLCHEEDVDGAHGVASGKLDKNKMFYLMAKGISQKEARKLLVKANLNKVINFIEDENTINEVNEFIDKLVK